MIGKKSFPALPAPVRNGRSDRLEEQKPLLAPHDHFTG
jgi:hypothetical protein